MQQVLMSRAVPLVCLEPVMVNVVLSDHAEEFLAFGTAAVSGLCP